MQTVNKQRYSLTFRGVVIADVLDGIPDDLLVVNIGTGSHLSSQKNHASLCNGLCKEEGANLHQVYSTNSSYLPKSRTQPLIQELEHVH